MNIFVTGGTGFIGTALIENLIQSGHQVTGLARSEKISRKIKNIRCFSTWWVH